jgi:hypothetical protein
MVGAFADNFHPMDAANLGDLLQAAEPSKAAIIDCRDWESPATLTYGALDEAANAIARGLLARGLKRGDRMAIVSANRSEFVAAYLGAMRAGLVAVPLNHKLPRATLGLVLEDCAPRLVLYDAARRSLLPSGVEFGSEDPDPENFLFLLHGPQSRAKFQGENAANYVNREYDALFEKMKNMPNSPERQQIIDRMVDIARLDAPWVWGVHPKKYSLRHSWISNDKPNTMARNNIKYLRIDAAKRAQLRAEWNRPLLWPVGLILALLVVSSIPAVVSYRRRERMAARPKSGSDPDFDRREIGV